MYVYVCIFLYIYHSIQRFELSMADKIAHIDNSMMKNYDVSQGVG